MDTYIVNVHVLHIFYSMPEFIYVYKYCEYFRRLRSKSFDFHFGVSLWVLHRDVCNATQTEQIKTAGVNTADNTEQEILKLTSVPL